MNRTGNIETAQLRGLVTDKDLDLAEQEFPGITKFHADCAGRFRTFLDLLAAYLADERLAA